MKTKEILDDLNTIDTFLDSFESKEFSNPSKLAVARLRNAFNLLSTSYLSKTKQLLKLIDIVLAHYKSTSSAYADILNRCSGDYDSKAFSSLVEGSRKVLSDIEDKLVVSINTYIKSKE